MIIMIYHVISWPAILDRESDKSTRWIKEAVHIRKEGRQSLNRDEPQVRPISCHVASLSWEEPEEELIILLLVKVSERNRNVKGKMLVVLS